MSIIRRLKASKMQGSRKIYSHTFPHTLSKDAVYSRRDGKKDEKSDKKVMKVMKVIIFLSRLWKSWVAVQKSLPCFGPTSPNLGTGGFCSFAALHPNSRRLQIVQLSNSRTGSGGLTSVQLFSASFPRVVQLSEPCVNADP